MKPTDPMHPRPGSRSPGRPRRVIAVALLAALQSSVAWNAPAPAAAAPQDLEDLEALQDIDRERRTGALRSARRELDDWIDEEPLVAPALRLRALVRRDEGDLEGAMQDARAALAQADGRDTGRNTVRACARTVAELHLLLGESAEALAALEAAGIREELEDSRDGWILGRVLFRLGERDEARSAYRTGADSSLGASWDRLLDKARCERALGQLGRASRSLVQAHHMALRGAGAEPDILVELGQVYFEADGEIEHPESEGRSPAVRFREALEIHPDHEGALVALYRLHRFNWRRQRVAPHELLDQLLRKNPSSIAGLLAGAAADVDDGRLASARERLARLEELAPRRREVRTLRAAMHWIEHRREASLGLLEELAAEDRADGAPEREVGRHLCELYRFAEAVPFLQRSVERDPTDPLAWTQLGRSLANTGNESAGQDALRKAIELAAGRQDAWRHNTSLVLERMLGTYVEVQRGDLTFVWTKEESDVLSAYQIPFYEEAREELSARYGYTADPVRIEVFRRHGDFSVRSTGFEGFPALGVCFGPLVTAISPVSEMRGSFSWARTAYHEFTHVIHLGLSHNRCPRWITEGLATWEEARANPTWARNMRRDLVDAYANDDLIPVRGLNRAFRGPRILFGYYQGGLLCRMLIDRVGFPPMIRLLEAFDRGLDLDQALGEVFDRTPEELDAEFRVFVGEIVDGLAIEPIWDPARTLRLRLRLRDEPPVEAEARQAWSRDWCTVAWSAYQTGRLVDSEQALRVLFEAQIVPPRALFLRGRIAYDAGRPKVAQAFFERGIEKGGEEYHVRMLLGAMASKATLFGEEDLWEVAEKQFLAAERAFPGFSDESASAELSLVSVYARLEREEDMQAARERWLAYNAGKFRMRRELAQWHLERGNLEKSLKFFHEANEVDPFRRKFHVDWGKALRAAGRHEEALREFGVAAKVPAHLDANQPDRLSRRQEADLMGEEARCLLDLGRPEEARRRAEAALEIDADAPVPATVLKHLP